MNRNQYLKEVCALVKKLGMPKSEVIRVCALKKDALEVEYNKLIALKNAPVAAEAPVELIEEVVEVPAEEPAEAFTFESATFFIGCNVNKPQRKLSPPRGISGFVWENMMPDDPPSLARFSKSKITVSLAGTIG